MLGFFYVLSGMLQTLPLPIAKCYMFHWEKDNFGSVQYKTLLICLIKVSLPLNPSEAQC